MVFSFSIILYKWPSEDHDILFMWCLFSLTIEQKCLGCEMLGLHGVTNSSWVCNRVMPNLWSSSICDHKVDSLNLLVRFPQLLICRRRRLFIVYQLLQQLQVYWSGQRDLERCLPIIFSVSTIWNCMCSSPHGAREKVSIPDQHPGFIHSFLVELSITEAKKAQTPVRTG